jgi:hypothetical protein
MTDSIAPIPAEHKEVHRQPEGAAGTSPPDPEVVARPKRRNLTIAYKIRIINAIAAPRRPARVRHRQLIAAIPHSHTVTEIGTERKARGWADERNASRLNKVILINKNIVSFLLTGSALAGVVGGINFH